MGIFDFVKDIALQPINLIKSVAGIPSDKEKKKQQQLLNQQIKSYQQQTEITKQELARKKDEETAEKRRVEEKQIRALRRSNRSQGFLGTSGVPLEEGQTSRLGG